VPYQAGTTAIAYNADRVAEPPASWADLWRPEYAGRLFLVDDPRYVIGGTLLSLGYDLNTRELSELREARTKLAALMPNVKLIDSSNPKAPFIAGDVDVGIVWNGEAFLAAQANPAIRYVYPREGAIFWQDGYAIPSRAAHPDAAYAWIEYSLQGDVFWLMLRDYPYTNPNRAALEYARTNHPDVYARYVDSPITNPPPDASRAGHRLSDVGDAASVYEFIWIDVGGR
jgi:spermidine/putrescine-binding protein